MSPDTTPIDPDILAEAADGALSVKQACVFCGESRTRLFALMNEGVLLWYYVGPHRRITRASLVRYVATLLAAHKTGAGART